MVQIVRRADGVDRDELVRRRLLPFEEVVLDRRAAPGEEILVVVLRAPGGRVDAVGPMVGEASHEPKVRARTPLDVEALGAVAEGVVRLPVTHVRADADLPCIGRPRCVDVSREIRRARLAFALEKPI
jgi:hypothetical protein